MPENQIEEYTMIGPSAQARAGSESTNPKSNKNNRVKNSWYRIKYRKQIEKYDRKSEYATKYVFQERGITIYPPYKNCVLAISLRGKFEHKRNEGTNKAS